MKTQASAALLSSVVGDQEWKPRIGPGGAAAILTLASALGLAACTSPTAPGERARREGGCPAEEICSDRTPKGLWFRGPRRFGTDVHMFCPTAVGGKQTLTALYADEPHNPYVAAFQARLTDRSIFSVDAVPPEIEVRASSAGKAMLRLLDADTSKLLDRIEIEAAPIARISLAPYDLPTPNTRWALLVDGRAPLALTLQDKDNRVLADETASVAAHGAQITQEAWDRYRVSAPYAGQVSFAVRAGGEPFFQNVEVIAKIQDITLDSQENMASKPLQVKLGKATTTLCFTARSGEAKVAGATWSFTPTPGVGANPAAPPEGLTSCVTLGGTAPGAAKLAIEASGFSKTFDLVVAR